MSASPIQRLNSKLRMIERIQGELERLQVDLGEIELSKYDQFRDPIWEARSEIELSQMYIQKAVHWIKKATGTTLAGTTE